MCRILFNPKNKPFDRDELKFSYQANPDGTGLYYYDKDLNKAFVHKWLLGTDFDIIWKTVSELSLNKAICNVAIHFRFATSAGKTKAQIHPIKVNNTLYLLHNGICSRFDLDPTVMSDTQTMAFWFKCLNFNLKQLKAKKHHTYLNNVFSGNKLLLVDKDDYLIINSDLGEWKDGIWRSWRQDSWYGWEWPEYDQNPSKEACLDENGQVKLFKY